MDVPGGYVDRSQAFLPQHVGLELGSRSQHLLGVAAEGRGMAVVAQHSGSLVHASWLRLPELDLPGQVQSHRCRCRSRHLRNHLGDCNKQFSTSEIVVQCQ